MTDNKTTAAAFAVEQQVQDPKGSLGALVLPCGYLESKDVLYTDADVREITGREEDMFASEQVPAHQKLGRMLAMCTTRVGPIVDSGALASKIVPDLLVGDRLALLIKIRQTSFGDEYPFHERCPNTSCPDHREGAYFGVRLSDLKVLSMPDPRQRVYERKTAKGRSFVFHPMTGRDEERIAHYQENRLTLNILARLDSYEGRPVSLEFVQSLGSAERDSMREAFEEVEGGIDTEVELACVKCGKEWATNLSIGQTGFFFPSRVRKLSKRKPSS